MVLRIRISMLLLAAVLTACQTINPPAGNGSPSNASPGAGTVGSSPVPAGKSAGPQAYQYIFKTPSNPIHLNITLDKNHSAKAVLGGKGGTISATGADGSVYTLDVPAKALAGATPITLTPVSSLTGLPFGGQSYAVQLTPEGLYFYQDAILTITPAKPMAVAKQIFLTYKANGNGVGLAAPVVKSKDIKIRLMHFSGYAVTEGAPADAATVQAQLGGDATAAIESLAAGQEAQLRENELDGTNVDVAAKIQEINDLVNQYEQEEVKPALEAAGDSCKAGKDAIAKLITLERARQLMGMDSKTNFAAQLEALLTRAALQCVKEEYQRCTEEHRINGMIPLWLGLKRQDQLMGREENAASEETRLAQDLTVKCLTFELQFHSKGSFDTGDGGYNSVVDGKLALHFDPSSFTIKGSGPLENQTFDFRVPKGGRGLKCTVDSKTGGGTAEVKSLEYVEDTRSETDPEFYVRDFHLTYFPGVTSESYHVHCIATDSQGRTTESDYTAPPSGYWSGIFFTLHQEELNGGGGGGALAGMGGGIPAMPDMTGLQMGAIPAMPAPEMPAEGGFYADSWDLTPGDALMASKEWIKNNGGADITESGTLKLYHKPGS
jgi:hypothetical protein